MSFDEKFTLVRSTFYEKVAQLFEKIAQYYGYPENPGMPAVSKVLQSNDAFNQLPKRITYFPPAQSPETWFEVIFGPAPKVDALPRYIYETKDEGFYNFYIENYRNMFFLPDSLSGYIQIHFNITVDHSNLELCRDVFFYIVLLYAAVVQFRNLLFWWIVINPYTYPWVFFVDSVDWAYDTLAGILPCVLGIDLAPTLVTLLIGKIADSANHLVFTMPFLPSEGNKVKMLIDGDLKDVVQFHYLPYLWYKYPIPINLREFWYSERPDILNFMEKNYSQFGINFRPLVSDSEVTSILDSSTFVDSIITTSKHILGLL